MTEQKRFPWLAVILGAGCVGVLCVGFLLIGGGAAFFLTQRSASPSMPEPVIIEVSATPQILPTATLAVPSPASVPTDSSPALTGDQRVDDHSLYDDFSSDALGWPTFDDSKTIIKYENNAYSFQVIEPDFYDWAYIPVDFIPYEIWFDVQGLPGQQNGNFGVFCHFQDVDNYYFVEFHLGGNLYWIGQYVDGKEVALTPQSADSQSSQSASALKSSPTSVNHIGVSCYLDHITLFINDQQVDDVSVKQPFDQPGKAALFVYTYEDAGENGYKVFFDNVEAWQPVQ
jgi:hypothetical protein